ncbi:bifunctional metallophosphatase/5'-nucleotidase [Pontivivens insulae]|uniref:Trifunctional nucleotide phosphoesterase protein YfkN n=1 Tax=Pontivivens insulae TaxID=1639689 RepID=A0A2R8AEH5_9RHOB|nr:5'-nucleotidase C-terminal domain-containing protein [Pontivivens insulae]RED11839.1 5'-nucleotidase [Pontivivens insulae]SPF30596.1 Trifunctional nucleotide phosphoesterase protein YfkN [Pontivivens insulae]
MSLKPMLAATVALSALTTAAYADGHAAPLTMTIIHTNDVHSRIEPINRFDSTCSAEDDAAGECFGGVARVATMINQLRGEATNPVVLDAGDQFQGSMFYTTYKGSAAAEFMNMTGYDVMAVGNHEFDDGPAKLSDFADIVDFPVISGNINVGQEASLEGDVEPYVVLDVDGQQVAVVSVLATDTAETSSPGDNVIFTDEIEYLQQVVSELEAEGIDKIIALTHVGFAVDQRIAENVAGLDAIVGGHSHTWFSSSSPDAPVTYPYWASGPEGALVPIVQAYAYSKYVGQLELTFDAEGNVIDAVGDTILLDASVEADPAIAARVAELAGPLEEIRQQVVASTSAPIDGDRSSCRAGECEMGVLVTDAMLDRVADQGVSIAITNGGGLRASIDAGEITMGEVLTVLPFQNTLATFDATGAMIIEALENGVSRVEDGAGRFPQVAGLRYTWNAANEPGSRIVSVEVADGDGWAPIDPDATYGVASNNYMRGGGDGYSVFENAENAYDFGPGLEVVVADFLAESGEYTPSLAGRVIAE